MACLFKYGSLAPPYARIGHIRPRNREIWRHLVSSNLTTGRLFQPTLQTRSTRDHRHAIPLNRSTLWHSCEERNRTAEHGRDVACSRITDTRIRTHRHSHLCHGKVLTVAADPASTPPPLPLLQPTETPHTRDKPEINPKMVRGSLVYIEFWMIHDARNLSKCDQG